jgi:Uma2 family endonuclease
MSISKDIYERVFHTPEYYCYDPATQQLEGWQLHGCRYQPLPANAQGWLWCGRLQRIQPGIIPCSLQEIQ